MDNSRGEKAEDVTKGLPIIRPIPADAGTKEHERCSELARASLAQTRGATRPFTGPPCACGASYGEGYSSGTLLLAAIGFICLIRLLIGVREPR